MSDPGKAVFLSYASQDAEAAKRICEALRAAGVEVWFDTDGGLEHGDEWDQKIRRQIKECVLFLPLISANTQAREEGYFRIEWELAAERAMGIAAGTAFILPIVIDDTREPAALVPDRFRKVQWTKLPGGVITPEVQARFLKLWSHRAGVVKHRAEAREQKSEDRSQIMHAGSLSKPAWKAYAALAAAIFVIVVVAGWWLLQRPRPAAPLAVTAAGPVAPLSPAARDWPKEPELKRAIALIEGLESIPDDLALAEQIVKPIVDRAPANLEAVTVMARVQTHYLRRGFDRSDERSAQARLYAERALQLGPDEPEAMYAVATYLYSRATGDSRAERLLRRAMELERGNPRHGRLLADLLNVTPGRQAEAITQSQDNVRRFPSDVLSHYDLARHYKDHRRYPEFDRELDATLALAPLPNALVWKARLQFSLHNDFPGMKAWLDRVPERVRGTERAVFSYFLYAAFGGDPEAGLEALRGFPQKWFTDFEYAGPTALLNASLLELQGKKELARQQYEVALGEIQRMRQADPARIGLSQVEFWTLLGLGQREEARASHRRMIEGITRPYAQSLGNGWWFTVIPASLLLGERDTALILLRESIQTLPESQAAFRVRFQLDPRMAPFRDDPEITALLADPEARKTVDSGPKTEGRGPIDQKSVAVLAFANLSDDKANEYFSDGISEELLNVLAKVPGLKVTARTSSFHFKGKDTPIPEIAKQLGVAYVIEGSVRKQGDKVRITAQLIKAADGFHVWSDTFTRDLKDIFAVQDEIAGLIAKELSLKFGVGSVAATAAVNPAALELYMRARQAWNLRTPQGFAQADELLNRAIVLAPNFAQAYALLAQTWTTRDAGGIIGPFDQRTSPAFTRIQTQIDHALALEPNLAEAHTAQGNLNWHRWKFDDAERELRLAIALNPNDATAHQYLGRVLLTVGRIDAGDAALQRAADLDPLSHAILDNRASPLRFAGRFAESLAYEDRALALQPDALQPNWLRATDLSWLGRHDEAVTLLRRLPLDGTIGAATSLGVFVTAGLRTEAEQRLARVPAERKFVALAHLGRYEDMLAALDPAKVPASLMQSVLFEPQYDPIRSDPRFVNFLAIIGLTEAHARAQAWRAAQPPVKPDVKK